MIQVEHGIRSVALDNMSVSQLSKTANCEHEQEDSLVSLVMQLTSMFKHP
jgi:hypothetical protein